MPRFEPIPVDQLLPESRALIDAGIATGMYQDGSGLPPSQLRVMERTGGSPGAISVARPRTISTARGSRSPARTTISRGACSPPRPVTRTRRGSAHPRTAGCSSRTSVSIHASATGAIACAPAPSTRVRRSLRRARRATNARRAAASTASVATRNAEGAAPAAPRPERVRRGPPARSRPPAPRIDARARSSVPARARTTRIARRTRPAILRRRSAYRASSASTTRRSRTSPVRRRPARPTSARPTRAAPSAARSTTAPRASSATMAVAAYKRRQAAMEAVRSPAPRARPAACSSPEPSG